MKRTFFVIITFLIVIIMTLGIFLKNKSKSFSINESREDLVVYEGSDPKGDYIEIQIDRDAEEINHINHTAGGISYGWYTYTAISQGPDTGGFSNMYRADVGVNGVEYIVFMEYDDTMVVYQQYDALNNPIGNPEYAIISRELPNTVLYETAYNYMMFNAKQPIKYNADMNCGFAAFDLYDPDPLEESGKLYGAGYSEKALRDPSATNGIRSITGVFSIDENLKTNPLSGSRYINIMGGIGMDDKLVMVGTPSNSLILDYGPGIGGGSGLMLEQAALPDWNATYNGTYYIMLYRYATASSESEINHYKLVFTTAVTGAGHIEIFNFMDNTSTGVPIFSSDLVAFSDLDGAHSPGGVDPLIDQYQVISDNGSADSTVVQDAHRCYGGFKAEVASTHVYLIFEPDGGFGGVSSVYTDISTSDKIYQFGVMVKDPDYSNFRLGDPEFILPVPSDEIDNVCKLNRYKKCPSIDCTHESGICHNGINFDFNNTPPEGSTPHYILQEIIAPCSGIIESIEYDNDELSKINPNSYDVCIFIKYNNEWATYLVLEPFINNTEDINLQIDSIDVEEGQIINRGDTLGYLVVSNRHIADTSDNKYPTFHWGVLPLEIEGVLEKPRYYGVCPYLYCSDEAKSELEYISNKYPDPEDGVVICVPPHVYPEGEPLCILPLPNYNQVYEVHHVHDVSDDYYHIGVDFHFNDWYSGDLDTHYRLHDVIAPCDGRISEIKFDEEGEMAADGKSVGISIYYNDEWEVFFGLETYSDNTDDFNLQKSEIYVGEGQLVSQGDLIARFVVSDNSLSNPGYPTIHWGISPKDSSGATLDEVCPYFFLTDEAKGQLDEIFPFDHSDP